MVALNFDCILLMLVDQGSIPWDTLQSQEGLNLGDVHFCSMRQMLCMQHISLDHLWGLITKGMFMPPMSEGPPKLSRTTAILLVLQVDGQHERITDVYVGLMVHRVESHLYTQKQILEFVVDIEVNLKVVHDAVKSRGDPGKRCAFCLFVSNYGGSRQSKATKQSPRAATPNPAVEYPKAKCSGSKGRHHRSLGCSSNTSTPKHPDSTSAKKPSSSKEPTSNNQEKSPRSCGSRKCSHSPSPSTESVRCKWKGVHTEDTCALNSTLPISSSVFDGFHSPMGSHSDVTELQPPSITSIPLGLGTPRQWQTMSDKSRHSLALIYTSPGFNLPGYPAAGPGNLTPSVPSLTGSHYMSSTWPAGAFTSGPSSPHLTINQTNSLFKLASECQALGIKLAKQFQVLSGLEAIHCNSIQTMAHETLMLRHSAQEATYPAIL